MYIIDSCIVNEYSKDSNMIDRATKNDHIEHKKGVF